MSAPMSDLSFDEVNFPNKQPGTVSGSASAAHTSSGELSAVDSPLSDMVGSPPSDADDPASASLLALEPAEPNDTIVIKNLPYALKKHDIEILLKGMSGCEAENIRLFTDAEGNFRGIAFVKYATLEEGIRAYQAVENEEVMGRKVRVEYRKVSPEQQKREAKQAALRKAQLQSPQLTALSTSLGKSPQNAGILGTSPGNSAASGASASGTTVTFSHIADLDMSDPNTKQLFDRVKDFHDNFRQTELSFPPTLTPPQRRIVHKVAEHFGIDHESKGEDTARFIELRKRPNTFSKAIGIKPGGGAPRPSQGKTGTTPRSVGGLSSSLGSSAGASGGPGVLPRASPHFAPASAAAAVPAGSTPPSSSGGAYQRPGSLGAGRTGSSPLSRSPLMGGSLGSGGRGLLLSGGSGGSAMNVANRSRSSSRGAQNTRVAKGPEGPGFSVGRGRPVAGSGSPLPSPGSPLDSPPSGALTQLSVNAAEFVPASRQVAGFRDTSAAQIRN